MSNFSFTTKIFSQWLKKRHNMVKVSSLGEQTCLAVAQARHPISILSTRANNMPSFCLGRTDGKKARPLQDGGGRGKARYVVVSACSESTYKNVLRHRRRACANVLSQSLLQTSRSTDMRGPGAVNSTSATFTQSNVSPHPTWQLPSSGRSSQQLKQQMQKWRAMHE